MIRAGATIATNGGGNADNSLYASDADSPASVGARDAHAFTDGESPGYVGVGESHVTAEGTPGVFPTPSDYFWIGAGTESTHINQEDGGKPGRVNRLAYDAKGPAYSGSTADFVMPGRRIDPGPGSVRAGGPVGLRDYRAEAAIAMAQSTVDFPDEALAQLQVLLAR